MTLATLVSRIETILEQIEAMRGELGALTRAIADGPLRLDVTIPRDALPIVVEPRPSLAVKAAQRTKRIGRVLMIGTGVLSVAGQIIALWKPAYKGPIIQALQLLASLGGG
jgi:hypothetical protein